MSEPLTREDIKECLKEVLISKDRCIFTKEQIKGLEDSAGVFAFMRRQYIKIIAISILLSLSVAFRWIRT